MPGRLITITHQPTVEEHQLWSPLTWQDVCGLAVEVLHEQFGSRWREQALRADVPASARLLYELLWYLEEEGFAVADALSEHDLPVFAGYPRTRQILHTLVAQACKYVEPLIPEGAADEAEDGGALWQLFERPAESWLPENDEYGGWPELLVCCTDDWELHGSGAPPAAAGFSFEAGFHSASARDDDWAARIAQAGYTWEVWGGFLRCYRTIPLTQVIERGETLDRQAQELGRWASRVIMELNDLRPNATVG